MGFNASYSSSNLHSNFGALGVCLISSNSSLTRSMISSPRRVSRLGTQFSRASCHCLTRVLIFNGFMLLPPFLLFSLHVFLHGLGKDLYNQGVHAYVALLLNRPLCGSHPYPVKKLIGKSY